MDLDLSKTSLWISIFIGAALAAAASAGFQKYGSEDDSQINIKGIIRDAILGGIFIAMAWTLVPDSMTSITESVTSTVASATVAATTVSKGSDFDVQVGPASF